jgi:hypothetical protein
VTRRCEVKGSLIEIDTVELTINEVEHGAAFRPKTSSWSTTSS